MASTTLFAPQIRATQPAFITGTVVVYFTLSAYNSLENVGSVKYQIANPHQASTWGTNIIKSGACASTDLQFNENTGEYYFSIDLANAKLALNQFYQIQIWLGEKGSTDIYSEPSQVSLIRPIPAFTVNFDWPSKKSTTNPEDLQIFSGSLSSSVEGIPADTLGAYSVKVLSGNTVVYEKTNIINSLGTRFSTKLDYSFRENQTYTFNFDYETVHGYKNTKSDSISTSSITEKANSWEDVVVPGEGSDSDSRERAATQAEGDQESPKLQFIFEADNSKANIKDGSIHLSFTLNSGSGKVGNGCTIVCQRSSDEDDFSAWTTFAEIKLARDLNGSDRFDIEDFYVKQDVIYQYRFLLKNSAGAYVYCTTGEYAYQADMEDIFLSNGKHQLAIRFNPQISNFKYVVQESITNALGGKFPIIRRNADTNYRQFSISGTLYFEGDSLFNENESLDSYGNSMSHWFGEPVSSFFLTTDEAYSTYKQFFASRAVDSNKIRLYENKFRNAAISFLTDGKPKLFRSAAEGNILVYLSNISFTPNQKLGGAVYNFSATATEFAECTYNNLKKYGLLYDFKYYQYVLEATGAKYNSAVDNEIVITPYIAPNKVRTINSKCYLVLTAKGAADD